MLNHIIIKINGVFFCFCVGAHWYDKMLVREREVLSVLTIR